MVCMIDDRNDVWKGFENNVIKVKKYSYFPGKFINNVIKIKSFYISPTWL